MSKISFFVLKPKRVDEARLTPVASSVSTSEPGKREDIFFAERRGVTGSRVLPIRRIGADVLFADGVSMHCQHGVKVNKR